MSEFSGIKGLGGKRVELLREAGIRDRDDLASLFPISYYSMENPAFADGAHPHCVIRGKLLRPPVVRYVRKGLSIARLSCEDAEGLPFSAVFYNRPYLKNQFETGAEYYFFGDLTFDKTATILNPLTERVEDVVPSGFYTVYPAIKGIPRAVLKTAVLDCVGKTRFVSVLPEADRVACGLIDADAAYRALHVPKSFAEIEHARRTVALEELTQLMLMFRLKKNRSDGFRSFRYETEGTETKRRLEKLPYRLTAGQRGAIEDIFADLRSERRMNRLVQGDVGSGKSIVAFAAMAFAAEAGRQAALMAPTEVLARQHFRNYRAIFGDDGVVCLTGGLSPKEKATIQRQIRDGEARVVIGTHSLFQNKVEYPLLSLVITDEQHRFGVAQRAAIEDKGRNADALIMSATPIPRTMALLLYGDLDVSVLPEKPTGRKEVLTRIVPARKKADMYRYLSEDAAKDRRTYLVVPQVDGDDDLAVSAKTLYRELSTGAFRDVPLGLLYGSMKEKEKTAALGAFAAGETKILISTTVVEVGVDVPEACNMVVLNADRFGLSQLHQLRGRVGRSDRQGYCFLLTDNDSPTVKRRLEFLTSCTDGFAVADYDLEIRGAGDFIGMSQHGFASALSNLPIDKASVDLARDLVEKLLTSLPHDQLILKEKYAKLVENVTMN